MNQKDEMNTKPRVFIVDDDKDILMMIGFLFESANAEVVKVHESLKAIEEIVSHTKSGGPFDLIVLDIRMPAIDGNSLAKRIRDEGYTGKIVALTAAASGKGRSESKESGFDHYLGKKELTSSVVQALLQK